MRVNLKRTYLYLIILILLGLTLVGCSDTVSDGIVITEANSLYILIESNLTADITLLDS